jgi:hypothetical protein
LSLDEWIVLCSAPAGVRLNHVLHQPRQTLRVELENLALLLQLHQSPALTIRRHLTLHLQLQLKKLHAHRQRRIGRTNRHTTADPTINLHRCKPLIKQSVSKYPIRDRSTSSRNCHYYYHSQNHPNSFVFLHRFHPKKTI